MLHHIPNVLSKEQVQYFREEMNKIEWVNGKVTAGTLSATVKQNQQLPEDHPLTHHLSHIILESLGQPDLSCTVFLSEPEEYVGGELVVEDTYGYHEVKLPAGDMILYPSTSLHEVTPITSGCRIASFFWIQSMIRDDAERHMLFNLDQSIQNLRMQLGDQHAEVMKLTNLYHNLMRKWAEL